MYQILNFNEAIPSCNISSIEYNSNTKKWSFNYILETPFEIKPGDKFDLSVIGHIAYLRLTNETFVKESINIHVHSYEEYMDLLESVRKEDFRFRNEWKKNNPNAKPNTIILKNKNYSKEELKSNGVHYIVCILEQNDEETTFVAI